MLGMWGMKFDLFCINSWKVLVYLCRNDGQYSLPARDVPDTITSWVLSGFALHDVVGMGVANPATVRDDEILLDIFGVGGAVRFLVVGTIGQEGKTTSSGWSSVWHCSNTGLSSSQYEQISIILGVWPFCLTPFFFSVNNILAAYG